MYFFLWRCFATALVFAPTGLRPVAEAARLPGSLRDRYLPPEKVVRLAQANHGARRKFYLFPNTPMSPRVGRMRGNVGTIVGLFHKCHAVFYICAGRPTKRMVINMSYLVFFRRADSVGGESGIRSPLGAQYIVRLQNAPSGRVCNSINQNTSAPIGRQQVRS